MKFQRNGAFPCGTPEKFNFKKPESWTKWNQRFERFRIASDLKSEEQETQVNTLIYFMGQEADDILASFKLKQSEVDDYETVIKKFTDHFGVRSLTKGFKKKVNRSKVSSMISTNWWNIAITAT